MEPGTEPNAGSYDILEAMSSTSATDVWAVGNFTSSSGAPSDLALHWDGQSWSLIPTPYRLPRWRPIVRRVGGSCHDAWAVGFGRGSSGTQVIVLHWNGQVWKQVAVPLIAGDQTTLWSVNALGPRNVWIAGDSTTGGLPTLAPLIEHWNGSKWHITPTPNAGMYGSEFFGISGSGANDAWAAGATATSSITSYVTLTEHWDGTKWSIVPSPNASTGSNLFYGTLDVAPGDAWSVGQYQTGSIYDTLTEHWDGKAWSVVPSPNAGSSGSGLFAVTGFGSANVWAVGAAFAARPGDSPLALHWNGKRWTVVRSGNLAALPALFEAATAVPGTATLWAAGTGTQHGVGGTLTAERTCALDRGAPETVVRGRTPNRF